MTGVAGLTDDVVRAAAGGAEAARTQVLEMLEPQIRLMVAARLSPSPAQLHAVEETAHVVIIALSKGISRLQARTVHGLRAYVSGIVTRKVSDLLHGRGDGAAARPVARSLDSTVTALSDAGPLWQFLSATDTTPRSAVERAEQTERLLSELGRLSPVHHQIITLAFFDQLPMREIAGQLGISRPAASMRLIRAVRTLRRNMTGSSSIGQSDGTAIGT